MPFFRRREPRWIQVSSQRSTNRPAAMGKRGDDESNGLGHAFSFTRICTAVLAWLCLSILTSTVDAQTDALGEETAKIAVTIDEINALRAIVESSESIDENSKSAAKQSLDLSVQDVQAAEHAIAETVRMQKAIDEVDESRDAIRQEMEAPPAAGPQVNSTQPLATLQQSLVTYLAALAEAEKALADAAAEPSRRQARLLAIPEERDAAGKRLEDIRKKLTIAKSEGGVDDQTTMVSEASRLRIRAAEMSLNATLEKLSTEQAYYVTTNDILPLQRQLTEQRVGRYRQIVDELNAAINHYRRDEISQLRDEIESSMDSSSKAQEIRQLLDQYEKIASRMGIVTKQRQEVNKRLEEVKTREQTMSDRVEAVGLTEALALLLQSEKTWLQTIRRQFRTDTGVRAEIRDLQVLTFKLEDQASEGNAIEPVDATGPFTNTPASTQSSPNDSLAIQRRRVLEKAASSGTTLFQELVSLDTSQRQLQEAIDRYLNFIEEKLLWTRSAPAIVATPPGDAAKGLVWLISGDRWTKVPHQWASEFRRTPLRYGAYTVLVLVLFLGASRWRHAIDAEHQLATKRNCVEIAPTLRATAATLLIAAPIPLALIGMGWVGSISQTSDEFLSSLSRGCWVTAGFLAPVLLLREICRVSGLGEAHFGWPREIVDRIRQACGTAAMFASPIVLMASTLRSQSDETITNSLGRYCILIFLGLVIVVLHRLLLPSRFWSGHKNPTDTWYRLRRLIYLFAIAIPITLAILLCSGYSYISHAIASRLMYTSAVLLVVVLVESIVLRATMLRRRKLAIHQLQLQRQQLVQKATEGDAALALAADVTADVDLNSVNQQARQLIRLLAVTTATLLVWMIWSDLLPALAMLDRTTLWVVGKGPDVSSVTLRDLLFSIVSISLTVLALKNLPAVIELLLLQKLPINPGARHAISTIFRYILGTVGVLIGLSFLSIPWSQLSWIVAAVSVGLGFGLQEIVANFVSGIILLLEQPIRVGDVVTVDGTTGVVTKMQIRATTVTNWDRQELVVPNKDLITGKLLNWTLSSVVNRVAFQVGVAYGTDIEQAHRLMMQAAASHPEVMKDPPPIVTLEQFGESALNFTVRCYLPSLDKRLQTIHELHASIAKTLDQAGIIIPFPQRDVRMTFMSDSSHSSHVRSSDRSSNPPDEG